MNLGLGAIVPEALHKSANTQMSQRKSATLRNLRRRPARPALGNGRVQRACRRAFWAHETPSTSDIIAFAYALRLHRDERRNAFNATVRRTLTAMGAIKIGRGPTRGRPWLWRWKEKYPQTMPMKTTAQIKRNSLPTTGCTNPSRSAGGKRIVTHVLTAAIRPARRLARTRPTFSPEKPPAGGAGPPSRRSGPTPISPGLFSGDFVSWNFWVSRMPLGAVNAGILAALPKFALYIVEGTFR